MHTECETAISLLARAAVTELPSLDLLQKAEERKHVDRVEEALGRVAGVTIDSTLELLVACRGERSVENLDLLCKLRAATPTHDHEPAPDSPYSQEDSDDLEDPFEVATPNLLPSDCFPLDILLHGCGENYPHLEILKCVVRMEKEKVQKQLRRVSLTCPPAMKGLGMLADSQESVLKGVQALVMAAARGGRERARNTPSPVGITAADAASTLQRVGRAYSERQRVLRIKRNAQAALSIQLAYRVMRAKRRINERRRSKHAHTSRNHRTAAEEYAVILLQSYVRGFLVRKLLRIHETQETSLEPIVDPADVTPEDSPLQPSNCSRISTGSRRRSASSTASCPGISLLVSMSEGVGLQMLLNSAKNETQVSEESSQHTPRVPSEGSKGSHRRKVKASKMQQDERQRPRFHHGSYLARKALPVGKRLTYVLLTAMGASETGWDIEQSPDVSINEMFVERHGVTIDSVYDAINPYGTAQPNGPHAAEVYGYGAFDIKKSDLVEQRDSATLYSHFKGQVLSSLLGILTERDLAPWIDCYKSIPLRDLNNQVAKHRLSRMLNDQLAMAEGTVTGMEKRLEHLYRKAAAPSKVADSLVEQLNTDLEEAKRTREGLVAAIDALSQPLPEKLDEIIDSDDDYMLGLSLEEIAGGTCVSQDATFMADSAGQLTTSAVIHTIFAPYVISDTVPNTLYNTYKLALTAVQQSGSSICCLSPLLPRAATTAITHPQHTVALHLMALAEVLTEQSWGLTACYISSFDVPVEIAKRAFEKRVVGFDLIVHSMDSRCVALDLGQPCALLVPADPMNILCGRVGARWHEARGKAYRQEEEVVSCSTAILLQAEYNTVYFEPVRHQLVDKKVPLLQRPLPPKRAPYTAAGKIVESRLPLGPKQRKRDLNILAKVKEVQTNDLELQRQLEIGQVNPSIRNQRMLEKVVESNEERQNFIQRLERRLENAPSQRELQKIEIRDRDDRIRQRREKRLLEQQMTEELKRQEEMLSEQLRKERNRQHQLAALERERRMQEKKEKMQNEKEGAQILAEARVNAERQKKVQAARELIMNEKVREEKRERQRRERQEQREQEKLEQEKHKQEDEKRKAQHQEEVRRKLHLRAAEEREKRIAQKATEEEHVKEMELKKKHIPKRGVPVMLPPMDRSSALQSHRETGHAAAAMGNLPKVKKETQRTQPERCSSAPDDLGSKQHFESMPPADEKAQTHVIPRAPPRYSMSKANQLAKPKHQGGVHTGDGEPGH